MKTNMNETSWEKRYRPDDLDEMALDPDLRQRFQRYLSGDVLPRHLILSGPPGFGKNCIAAIIAEKLYGDKGRAVKRVTISAETGKVEFIRTTVINGFMRSMMFGGSKLLIFEEASDLSPESQEALRVPMEEWSDLCQIVFLTNELLTDKAVRDRCDVIEMVRPPIPECAHFLAAVLTAEDIGADPTTVQAFTRWHFAVASDDDHRSMRGLLRAAQDAIATDGKLPVPPEAEYSSALMLEEWRSEYRPEDATDGAKLLNDLADAFATYLSLPKGGKETLALWTVFAWAHEAFTISPIITLTSPTMRAGKSTAFELLEQLLIPGATYHPSSMTPAVVYRLKGLAEAGQDAPPSAFEPPTLCLLMDEADNWLGNHQLRAVLNSGWKRRGAKVARMVGAEPGWFSSWYPKALALIDRADAPLPGTLRDRSIIVPMQRKSKDETVTLFPSHQLRVPALEALCKATLYWVSDHFATLRDLGGGAILADGGLNDRARNNHRQRGEQRLGEAGTSGVSDHLRRDAGGRTADRSAGRRQGRVRRRAG